MATVDADTLRDRDALSRIVEIFSADPDRVVAVGGTIRIVFSTTAMDLTGQLSNLPDSVLAIIGT